MVIINKLIFQALTGYLDNTKDIQTFPLLERIGYEDKHWTILDLMDKAKSYLFSLEKLDDIDIYISRTGVLIELGGECHSGEGGCLWFSSEECQTELDALLECVVFAMGVKAKT